MIIAYNIENLKNLFLLKEVDSWKKSGIISQEQSDNIKTEYKSNLWNPNIFIRIALFIATMIAVSSASGFVVMIFNSLFDLFESIIGIIVGIVCIVFVEKIVIRQMHHYKSGVTEFFIYSGLNLICFGICDLYDFRLIELNFLICGVFYALFAIRYLDILSTIGSIFCFSGLIFYSFYNLGGIFTAIIPIIFFVVFLAVYFAVMQLKKNQKLLFWKNNLFVIELFSLLLIYFSVNYLVVRELSIKLMDMVIQKNEDIPLAWLFYALTIIIPLLFIYFGIKKRDVLMLRIGILTIGFTVFTFKYYYSLGHPEITLTLAGAILLGVGIYVNRLLKASKGGFTREKVLDSKWQTLNAEAFIISQTMGGNMAKPDDSFEGGGGEFGGGGASGSF